MRITLRLPDELHGALEREASRSRRSLNSEIVSRLESLADTALTPSGGMRAAAVPLPGEDALEFLDTVELRDVEPGRRGRTGLCEHRVPATAHCPRCDS